MSKSGIIALAAVTAWSLGASAVRAGAEGPRATTVGMPARIEQLILPGTELEPKPLSDRRTPVVVRITQVFPHGTAFRYDLAFYGLEPGEYDLRHSLRRKDGSPTTDLPPIPVTVSPVLPPGHVLPNALELRGSPRLGGYRLLLALGAVAWVAGLVAILRIGRRKRAESKIDSAPHLTLAERLGPLVEAAVEGRLSEGQQAELERLLIGYWWRRLDLDALPAPEAMARLRDHEEAGALLRHMESWLHQPGGAHEVDVASLLRVYRDLPADAVAETAGPVAANRNGPS